MERISRTQNSYEQNTMTGQSTKDGHKVNHNTSWWSQEECQNTASLYVGCHKVDHNKKPEGYGWLKDSNMSKHPEAKYAGL